MPHNTNRRRFLQTTAAAGAGYWVAGGGELRASRMVNDEIRFACIGIGGKGSSDSQDAARHGKVVAIVDIDQGRLDGAAQRFEGSRPFIDYREMYDEMADEIDAVTVSTPDHSHASAAIRGMRLGKACFCQKPLTHSIGEARMMAETAREFNVATQMGNQGTAGNGLRRGAAQLKAGVLGEVSELHVWTNRPVWPQGGDRPERQEAPDNVHWDMFLGPAPARPYARGYHPFAWRGWWDFGTGALGDMACHTVNMPFMGLDIRDPLSVEAEHTGHNNDSFPSSSTIKFEFGQLGDRAPLTFTWYDGGRRPSSSLLEGIDAEASGCLVVGEKGRMYSPDDYGSRLTILGTDELPDVEYPRSPGHFTEWVEAIKGGEPAVSNFPDYAVPLTETILLGNLALWCGEPLQWDAEKMVASVEGLEEIIMSPYREGWEL